MEQRRSLSAASADIRVQNQDEEAAIWLDPQLSSESIRLYHILADGKSLAEAARIMDKAPRSLARYERQLRKAKYLALHHVLDEHGKVQREYRFPKRTSEREESIAS
jgi:hypothetical protein